MQVKMNKRKAAAISLSILMGLSAFDKSELSLFKFCNAVGVPNFFKHFAPSIKLSFTS